MEQRLRSQRLNEMKIANALSVYRSINGVNGGVSHDFKIVLRPPRANYQCGVAVFLAVCKRTAHGVEAYKLAVVRWLWCLKKSALLE